MNKENVLFHLGEALESLQDMIQEINSDPEYEYGNYLVDMMHLYHHINTAWNAQNISSHEAEHFTEEDFYKWRQFPVDIPLD